MGTNWCEFFMGKDAENPEIIVSPQKPTIQPKYSEISNETEVSRKNYCFKDLDIPQDVEFFFRDLYVYLQFSRCLALVVCTRSLLLRRVDVRVCCLPLYMRFKPQSQVIQKFQANRSAAYRCPIWCGQRKILCHSSQEIFGN